MENDEWHGYVCGISSDQIPCVWSHAVVHSDLSDVVERHCERPLTLLRHRHRQVNSLAFLLQETMRKGLAAAAVVLLFPCSHAFVGPACPCASSQMFSTTSDTRIRNPNDLRRTGRAGFTPPLRRQHQQPQQQISILKRTVARMTSFDPSAFDSAVPAAFPQGPGAGVIDLRFENLKAGGFKVFLLLFLLGVSDVGVCCTGTDGCFLACKHCERPRIRQSSVLEATPSLSCLPRLGSAACFKTWLPRMGWRTAKTSVHGKILRRQGAGVM